MHGRDLVYNGEIVLNGSILSSGDEEWYESGIITSSMVRDALALVPGDVTVRVNSPGGDPTEGEAIRVLLAEHDGTVTVKVAGDAISAASLMIMGADRIEMSEGSIMMIHDPATVTFGDAAAHRKSAGMLDVLADTYAAVYARRSGKSAAEVRALMQAETWFGPEAAVAEGFADAVTGFEPETADVPPIPVAASMSRTVIDAGRARFAEAVSMAGKALRRDHSGGGTPAPQPAPAGDLPEARRAATKEPTMSKPTDPATTAPETTTPPQAQQPASTTPAPQVAATMAAPSAADAIRMERERVRAIREMGAPHVASGLLMQADVDAVIDDGTGAEAAGQRFLASMAAAQPPAGRAGRDRVTITRDETDTRMEGMIGALMGQAEGPASEYRGLRLKSLAMHLAGSARGFNEAAAVRAGMRATSMMGGALGVSDFAYITTEVMGRTLTAEYQRRAANWTVITGAPVTASDFRELHAVRFGGDFSLKPVAENGEYQQATLADEAEGLKVERRGRTINLTFEAIINDDMGAFQRIPREFAMAARVMEASMVWGLIRANAALKSDKKALFHADHRNLAGAGGALSTATVAAGRKALWEQTAFGSKDKDDFLMVEPNLLLVPPALEMAAGQFTASVTPAKDADANPFKASVTPVVAAHLGAAAGGSDTAWYLVSSDLPPVTHAYLDGYQAPTVQTIEGMNPDKVTMNARHIFGAAVTEYRGAYKNPGA
ncbi:head maturation protease, ClpP-related [Oceanicella sp. SM1341]|uniref:head maturation protease, ClpP-related n=1 Tax=Oceanicella sp. SM1341 TaxID=1548889 RepID=UPI0018E5998C|nr:head maturation protease, ClpP-related [Oceanicella sp. SM1341]